jgi:hypothetical protein
MHSLILYIICGLFLCQHTTAQWAPYPTCVQQLQSNNQLNYGPADCNFGWSTQEEIDQTNACLCPDESFESEIAQAIYTNCGCNDLITSASLMVTACELAGTISIYDEAQIISVGDGGQFVCQNINTSSAPAVVPKSTVTISMLLLTKIFFSSLSSLFLMILVAEPLAPEVQQAHMSCPLLSISSYFCRSE